MIRALLEGARESIARGPIVASHCEETCASPRVHERREVYLRGMLGDGTKQRAEMASSDALAEQVNFMGRLLGEVITALEGPETLALEEHIRLLAKRSRAGEPDAAEQLRQVIAGLSVDEAYEMAMAFTTYFELVNLCEEHHRTAKLRHYRAERAAGRRAEPIRESIEAALIALKSRGVTSEALQAMLDKPLSWSSPLTPPSPNGARC